MNSVRRKPMENFFSTYHWQIAIAAALLAAICFNFFAKWLIGYWHAHFENKNLNHQGILIQSLYLPLSTFSWFFAIIYSIKTLLSQFTSSTEISDLFGYFLTLGVVVALTWFGLRWKKRVAQYLVEKSYRHETHLDATTIDILNKIGTIVILFLAVLLGLEASGRSLTTLIAFGGLGGLAIAFASQEVISNFFGGLMIYLNRPFSVGDQIVVPEHNIKGVVEEIGWYMTRLRSFEKTPIYVPNSIFSKVYVETLSRMSHRCFNETLKLGIMDNDKSTSLINHLKKTIVEYRHTDQSQANTVNLNAINDKSTEIQVTAFLHKSDLHTFLERKQELLLEILTVLRQHDVKFAPDHLIVDIPEGIKLNT